ncbi:WW domain,Double-stranded RNA-binding domain [Cinara cedri]|uniref:WW domain,Double-stranded RNA-binding domain n=1 Tax=Cinara cedri TaxID=506608 RepID=A0A5E4M0Q5_9HEMI|nr:WW domain,Double-stranded RNA-binding domain [Cinara cedri]
MSNDSEFSFDQGEHSEFESTSNVLESHEQCIASCSKSMEYHSTDSDDEEQIDNIQKEQKNNEFDFASQFESIASRLKSMEYPIGISDDEDEQIDKIEYVIDTSDEDEQVDHLETGQNGNVIVSDDQLKSIVSRSKSVEYHLSDISDEDEQIDSISAGYGGNETVVLNELDEKFVKNNLPTGWTKINHASGMPLYFNKDMKVCSFTKPYYLGTQSLKNHNVPVENIPCLEYKLKLEKMNSKKEDDDKLDYLKKDITPEQYKSYCKRLFKFKDIKFMRFSSWDKRREYIRMIKADRRRRDLPKFKDRSTLIAVPVDPPVIENTAVPETGEWIINLNNKSYISILHEYIQRVLKTQPLYTFKELENARYPYLATVILDGIQYGIGIGSSKKQAKLDSARATMEILLPSTKDQIKINCKQGIPETQGGDVFNGCKVFDQLKIKDPRIPEFCAQAAESMPYDMLLVCVKRNFGEDVTIKTDMQKMQSNTDSEIFYSLTMKAKEYMATVICKNKREGRQKGAQALLKVLHPHIKYFGSLLRLYSHQNVGSSSEKKPDEPGTKSPRPRGSPDQNILDQLKKAMSKLEKECNSNEENDNSI